MNEAEARLWEGVFAVVDTESTWYLGTVRIRDGHLVVYTGMTGRPPVVPLEQVDAIAAAQGHPSVVPAGRRHSSPPRPVLALGR